jgi:MoxR-like ATPase
VTELAPQTGAEPASTEAATESAPPRPGDGSGSATAATAGPWAQPAGSASSAGSEHGRDGRLFWGAVRDSVGRAVIGGEGALRLVLVALLADGHALIEDVPGIGKTLLARAVARSLDIETRRIQGTPDLLPVDVTGGSVLDGGSLRFVPGPVFTNILLVDEINRATPRTQSALLEAMQERQVSIEGATHPLPEPFLVMATQNPIEYEGTFALPEAQLDRFLVRIRIGYPDTAAERRIARRYREEAEPLDQVTAVADGPAVLGLRDLVREIEVSDEVEAYVVSLASATRDHPDLQLGASPRASVALYRASQAWAFLEGRDFALPDDVKAVARPVLAHRLMVDLDRGLRGVTAEGALAEVLDSVPAPPVAGD